MSATQMDTEHPININISKNGSTPEKYNKFKEKASGPLQVILIFNGNFLIQN